jgi:hypothetical protein
MAGTERPSKAINEYLNHYIMIADGKAVAVAAAALVIVGFALDVGPGTQLHPLLRWIGVAGAALSAVLAGSVLYPRLAHSGNGHIFWEDIRSHETASAYCDSLSALDEDSIEREYARQNFIVSGILRRKNAFVRYSIITFAASCILVILSFWIQRPCP